MRLFLLPSFVLFLHLTAGAQSPFPYSLKNFKAIDGLPQSQVKAMVEDKRGYLWLGTEGGGLARFDGRNFTVYTTLDGLQSNIVEQIIIDRHERLWIMHPRGITRFDGRKFKRFEREDAKISNFRLRRLFDLGDSIFFLSAPGTLGKIHNDSLYYWSQPLLGKEQAGKEFMISFVRMAPDGTAVFSINRKSFYCRSANGSFWIPFELQYNNIHSVFNYRNDFFLQTDEGFFSLDMRSRKIVKQSLKATQTVLAYDSLRSIFWTTAHNRLLKEYEGKDGTWKVDTVLKDVGVAQVLLDQEGNTWFGTNGNGLYKYFVQDFDRFGSDKLSYVLAIYKDSQGVVWVGSATRGLYKIENGRTVAYNSGKNLARGVFFITESPDKTLYVAGGGGLGTYDRSSDSFTWETFPLGNDYNAPVINVQFDERGGQWIGTGGKGLHYHVDGRKVLYSVRDGLSSNVIQTLHYSQVYKSLFIGDEFGLSRMNGNQISAEVIQGLENTSVLSIQPYRDSLLLVSTGGAGLIIYHPGSRQRRFLTTRDGLASDFIYFAAADREENVWIGSEKGISMLTLDNQLNLKQHQHYNDENGLTGVEANQNAFCFTDDMKLFGLVDGLYQYNDQPRKKAEPFNLHLTDIQLSYGEHSAVAYGDTTYGFFNIPVNLQLPPERNHITFYFNRVSKSRPKSVKFRYMLQGFDNTWSQAAASTHVTYSNVPPGAYTFLVSSTDNNGGWSQIPLSYEFTVRSPFYATTSFIVGSIVFSILAISLILYLRVRSRMARLLMLERIRIEEQEKIRKEIARDFHDEMGNHLTRIINYISLLKMSNAARNGQKDLYSKVEDSAKHLYVGTRDFIWSIDPSNEELSRLFIHLRDFGEKLFEEKNISFRATNTVARRVKLPYGFSREANLIFKEGMTNAFKYSEAKNITFSLLQVNDAFEFILEDDGIGYDAEQQQDAGRGLKNIRERAEKIGVTLTVNTSPGRGTSLSVKFKNVKSLKYGITV